MSSNGSSVSASSALDRELKGITDEFANDELLEALTAALEEDENDDSMGKRRLYVLSSCVRCDV